jgi:hypothetical protein
MVAQDLVVTWEDVYRRYAGAVGEDVTKTSWAVARAWRELAARTELPWWLSAAVRSAAQAFEHQAEALAAGWGGRDDMASAAGTANDDRGDEDEEEEHRAYHRVVLPVQGTRQTCACAHTPLIAETPNAVAVSTTVERVVRAMA